MTDMSRRTLGRTGLEVTTLGFGAMELRGAPTARRSATRKRAGC